MKDILITVKNKIAMNLGNATYICDNSDYRVSFDFDEEWDEHPVKTARFKYNDQYQEVVFTGNECPVPLIRDARLIYVGVYAGNLQTSTPAVIHASQSILSGDAVHTEPEEDVYHQLVELVESGVLKGDPGETPEYGVDYGTQEQITEIANKAAEVLTDVIKNISDGKVDKVDGMGLSSNDYDKAAKDKVDAIPKDPKYSDTVYDDTAVKDDISQIKDDLTDLQTAKMERYSIKTVMDSVATPHAQYYLGNQTAVDIVLPDSADVGQIITVCWYNGATAATLSITGTMLAFDYTPSANTRSEINALWDGSYWAVLGNEMEVPSE